MADATPIQILILGHSFVKRLRRYATDKGCKDLALGGSIYDVHFHGISGLKLSGLLQKTHIIKQILPKIVFLEIGTNDLAMGCSPVSLAKIVKDFASFLIEIHAVELIVIAQVTLRDAEVSRYPLPRDFNARVIEYNQAISQLTKGNRRVQYWRHRGLWAAWKQSLCDGVHFSQDGLRKHYNSGNSVRAAIVASLNRYANLYSS